MEAIDLARLQKWRNERAAGLSSPDGWLSLVALQWLKPGTVTVGSAASNTLRLKRGPRRLAVLSITGDTVRLSAPDGGYARKTTLDGKPAGDSILQYGEAHTSELRNGSLLMTIIRRGDRLYLRVRDSEAPARRSFHGLNWFPPDGQYRILARWIPSGAAGNLTITNVLGQTMQESSPGMAEFKLYGQVVRLFPIIEKGAPEPLFFIFRDATSKSTSYGAGRFLYAAPPSNGIGRPGTVLLDFNKAENPPCAYTAFATCPLPPQQNRLTIPIPAGEKRYEDVP